MEVAKSLTLRFNPLRSISLDRLHELRDLDDPRQRKQNMQVIANATDRECGRLLFPKNCCQVGIQLRLDLRGNIGFAILSAKD